MSLDSTAEASIGAAEESVSCDIASDASDPVGTADTAEPACLDARRDRRRATKAATTTTATTATPAREPAKAGVEAGVEAGELEVACAAELPEDTTEALPPSASVTVAAVAGLASAVVAWLAALALVVVQYKKASLEAAEGLPQLDTDTPTALARAASSFCMDRRRVEMVGY